MGFFKRFFNRTVSQDLTIDQLMEALRGGTTSKSGVTVDWQTALQVTTVLACVRKIADGLLVPVKVYKRDPKTGQRAEAREHPLYDLLANAPNEYQSGYEYRETLAVHAALTGNAYSFIVRAGKKITELLPIDPGLVTVNKSTDRIVSYTITGKDKATATVPASEIWHVRGLTWDGTCGLDSVRLAREAIGLALATEQSHASIHKNGVMPSGVLSVDGSVGTDDFVRLAAWVKANFTGLENASRAMVLDRNAKWQPLRMSGVDSEHIKTREMQIDQICQAFNVLPEMIGVATNNTSYASVEQVYIAHLVHTVRPWHDRFSHSQDRWLLTADERKQGYYTGFVSAAFLQPAMKDKAEFNKIALGGGGNPGWVTPNEVRSWDEMAPIPGGNNLYVPIQLGPMGADGMPKQATPPATPAPKKPAASATDPLNVGRVLSAENERLLREASGLIGGADDKLTDVLKKLDKQEEE